MASPIGRPHAWWITVAIVLFCGVVSVVNGAAQATDATIYGQIKDESGAVLPGVTVTVSSPVLQVKQIVEVTNANGEYRVTPLPLGTYVVEYSLTGFQTLRHEELRLTAGFAAKIDGVLKIGAVAESVTVSGQSPVVDVKTTASSTQLTREILEASPTGRNGLQALMGLASGTRTNLDFGQYSFTETAYKAYGRSHNPWSLIEGVAVVSAFSSGPGLATRMLYESTDEATVQTVGSGAESPTSGIQMNVIVKSGGNTFHGGGTMTQFPGQWAQGDNVDAALAAQGITNNALGKRWQRSIEFGGRIVPNRLWFYTAARMRADVTPIPATFFPDGTPGSNTTSEPMWSGKVSYQLSQTQKIVGWQQWENRSQDASDWDRFHAYESRGIHKNVSYTRKLEWQMAKGNKLVSLLAGSNSLVAGPYPSLTNNSRNVDEVTGFITGVEDKAGSGNDYWRRNVRATLSWYKPDSFHGNHDIKSGLDYTWAEGNNFSADRDLEANKPGNYNLNFRSGAPFTISVQNNPVTPHNRVAYLGVYLQDSWTIARRLTLNLGIRAAHDRAYLPEQCRDAAPREFATLYPAECFPFFELTSFSPVVPRIHAAYDLTGDGRTVLKGGWGRFNIMHGADEVTIANQNSDIVTTFLWHDLNGDKKWQPGEANLSLTPPDFVSRALTTNGALIGLVNNPDLKQAGSDEFNVSLERQLMRNFGVRVTGIYSKNFNTYRIENELRPYSSYNIPITNRDPGPDNVLGTRDDPGTSVTYYDYPANLAGNAFQRPRFINDANSDANYKSFEITANKRLSNRWQAMASYSTTSIHEPYVFDITGQKATNVTTYTPNAEINAANNTREWEARINGSYAFPYGFQTSANLTIQSGAALARTVSFRGGRQVPSLRVRVEPIGSSYLDTIKLLTLRIDKDIKLTQQHHVKLQMQIYNALNSNTITAANQSSGATYLAPTAVNPPRVAEIGFTYQF